MFTWNRNLKKRKTHVEGEDLSVLLTGHHVMPVVTRYCFYFHQYYWFDAMPRYWSTSDLPQVLRIWESVFYLQAFFTLHPSCFLRLPWRHQFNIKVRRSSCCGSKHSRGLTICLNHTVFTKRYYLVGSIYLLCSAVKHYISLAGLERATCSLIAPYVASYMSYPIGNVNFLRFMVYKCICVLFINI